MEYHLYPPFFIIEPQTSFSKAWEDFCRRLLNLAQKTTEICHRTPPDRGIDLLWDGKKIAYQCKAVENGQAGELKVSSVIASIKKAQEYQIQIGWQKYVLCTNVDLTDPQFERLRKVLPDIERLECGYWTDCCKQFHEQIADRFRQLIPVPSVSVQQAINQAYLHTYLRQFQEHAEVPTLNILLYSQKRQHIFELPVPSTFSVRDLLFIVRELFELPGPRTYRDLDITVSLEYSLHINNKEAPTHKKLDELQTDGRPLVTLWKTIIWYDTGRKTEDFVMENTHSLEKQVLSTKKRPSGPVKIAVERYQQEIENSIDKATARFEKNQDLI